MPTQLQYYQCRTRAIVESIKLRYSPHFWYVYGSDSTQHYALDRRTRGAFDNEILSAYYQDRSDEVSASLRSSVDRETLVKAGHIACRYLGSAARAKSVRAMSKSRPNKEADSVHDCLPLQVLVLPDAAISEANVPEGINEQSANHTSPSLRTAFPFHSFLAIRCPQKRSFWLAQSLQDILALDWNEDGSPIVRAEQVHIQWLELTDTHTFALGEAAQIHAQSIICQATVDVQPDGTHELTSSERERILARLSDLLSVADVQRAIERQQAAKLSSSSASAASLQRVAVARGENKRPATAVDVSGATTRRK